MPTYNEEKKFIEAVISRSLLDDAIDWIAKNLNPEEVFPATKLESWATENGFTTKEEEQ